MTEQEKPLHVRVAEALGWRVERRPPGGILLPDQARPGKGWVGWRDGMLLDERKPIPDFDTDWAATGPLIEKYGIWVHPCDHDGTSHWVASNEHDESIPESRTPLEAVCHLILALKEAGKL